MRECAGVCDVVQDQHEAVAAQAMVSASVIELRSFLALVLKVEIKKGFEKRRWQK